MTTLITAHSGAEHTPDNSREYIKAALQMDCGAFEVDIMPIGGEYLLTHDTAADTSALVRLAECFELMRDVPEKLLNCDMKVENSAAGVLALARKYGLCERLIFTGAITSTDARDIEAAGAQWWMNVFMRAGGVSPESVLAQLKARGCGWINIDKAALSPEMLEAMQAGGVSISVWTVNDAEQVRMLLDSGVNNITSRSPICAQEILNARC